MKIVIAIDSFKGSLSSSEAAQAIRLGIEEAVGESECVIIPVADGGEGTIDALSAALGGQFVTVPAADPLGRIIPLDRPNTPQYLLTSETNSDDSYPGQLAVIEMAQASGITLLKEEERNPLKTSTYGTGQLLLDGLNRGYRNFLIAIGGSATSDGGMGMLRAVGVRFLDFEGHELDGKGENLSKIDRIDPSNLDKRLLGNNIKIRVLCDVDNPLYGKEGAAYIFAPQKCNSAMEEDIIEQIVNELDRGLRNFSQKASEAFIVDEASISQIPGAGAAGGLGAALGGILQGKLIIPGIEEVLNVVKAENHIKDADWVVTGEGRLDQQTSRGKVPIGVASLAHKYQVPVIAFSGSIVGDPSPLHERGIDAFFSIINRPLLLEEAMSKDNAITMLRQSAREVFRLIKCVKK